MNCFSGYVRFDGMRWPDPSRIGEVGWAMRYKPEISQIDRYHAAEIIEAYIALFGKTQADALDVLRKVKKAIKESEK